MHVIPIVFTNNEKSSLGSDVSKFNFQFDLLAQETGSTIPSPEYDTRIFGDGRIIFQLVIVAGLNKKAHIIFDEIIHYTIQYFFRKAVFVSSELNEIVFLVVQRGQR